MMIQLKGLLILVKQLTLSFITLFLVGLCVNVNAQNVGVGTNNPQEKLHVNGHIRTDGSIIFNPTLKNAASSISISNTDGLVVLGNSSGSQGNAISMSGTPKAGQVLYILNADDDNATFGGHTIKAGNYLQLVWYNGSWNVPSNLSSFSMVEDADGDTKIQVEEGTDDDKIRFDIDGAEAWQMDGHRLEANFRGNICIGWETGLDLEDSGRTGSRNMLLGEQAGTSLTNGNRNVAIGYRAGKSVTTGDKNVFIGNEAGENETGSEKLYIDNSSTSTPLIEGDFANDELRINGELQIKDEYALPTTDGTNGQVLSTDGSGNVSWSSASSGSDNQTIDAFSLSGSTLSLSLEDDGEAAKTVDLSGLASTGDEITDADADTKIQVEESGDDDKIRIDIAGSEMWVFENERLKATNSNNNILIGTNTGAQVNGGDDNIFIGNYVGVDNTTGDGNVFMGDNTGANNTTGSWNTAVGINAMNSNTTGVQNVAVGNRALYTNTSGEFNTGLGRYALNKNTTGDDNVALGHGALNDNTTGNNNTGLGSGAGFNNRTGVGNVFIGHDAGANETGSNTLYIDNSSTANPLLKGDFANDELRINGELQIKDEYALPTTDGTNGQVLSTDGSGNVSWSSASSGSGDEIIDADNDTKIQVEASTDEDVIRFKIAGTERWRMTEDRIEPGSNQNIFIGNNTGEDLASTGYYNAAYGNRSQQKITTGDFNSSIGDYSLRSITTGSGNVGLGSYAGYSNQTGSNNVFIGNTAGYQETGSNKLYIDNSTASYPLIYGDFSNDLLQINGTLSIWNNYEFPTSDGQNGETLITNGSGDLTWGSLLVSNLKDNDNDTKIQVEKWTDEDVIRFDIGGSEKWRMTENRLEPSQGSSTFIGVSAGEDISTGYSNTAYGYYSQQNTSSGDGNTSIGRSSLQTNTTGNDNTAIGANAGYKNQTGSGNVFIGRYAGYFETGSDKLYIDNTATSTPLIHGDFDDNILTIHGELSIKGQYSFPLSDGSSGRVLGTDGNGSLSWVTNGGSDDQQVDLFNLNGTTLQLSLEDDGQTNRTVDLSGIDTDNQTIDVFSLSGSTLSLSLEDDAEATKTVDLSTLSLSVKEISDADNDTKIQVEESADEDKIRIDIAGTERWIFNADRLEPVNALHNILIGENTGTAITTGYSNVLLGENAGEDITTGNGNTYIGQNVGSNTTTGDWNTAIGINSMNANTTGTQNTAIGNKSLYNNTSGTHNTAIGRYALRANTTGLYNTSLGMDALGGNTEGESNLGLGFQAGYSNTDGDGNVYIGYQAGYNASGDKKLYIDYGPSTSPLIYGEFANNILEINGVLRPGANNTHSLGSSTKRWTAVHATNGTIQTSDVRFKKNIENMSYGLDDLMKIRSVSYEWKEDSTGNTKLGFIAQELEQIVPEVVTVANDSMQTRGVNYAELVPVLVKAIQEQQAEIEAYKLKVEQAELKNAEMTKKFESYEEELATIKSYLIGIVKED